MTFLFLYSELAEYFLSCIHTLATPSNVLVHIIRKEVNEEAPFNFNFPDGVKIYDRSSYDKNSLLALSSEISPDLIYCSGWIDRDYLAVCRRYKGKIPVILGMDNIWQGTLKQHFASIIGPFFVKKYFSHCWVPGNCHKKYAEKIGFDYSRILDGVYSADFNFFYKQHLLNAENKKKKFPKRFIFVGRYYEFKGIKDLWSAFVRIQNESANDWELWCLGTGDVNPAVHLKIKHFGFIQPAEMPRFIAETGVFVLPSRFEPWGVTVHEFASAGFPLIGSGAVGSADTFIEDGYNGFLYKSGDISGLIECMKKCINMSDNDLFRMGERSTEMAKKITPKKWADTLYAVLKSGVK